MRLLHIALSGALALILLLSLSTSSWSRSCAESDAVLDAVLKEVSSASIPCNRVKMNSPEFCNACRPMVRAMRRLYKWVKQNPKCLLAKEYVGLLRDTKKASSNSQWNWNQRCR